MQQSPPEVEPTRCWPGRRSLLLSPAGLRHQPTPTEASISRQAPMWTKDTQSRSQSGSKTLHLHSPQLNSKINPDILVNIFLLYTKHEYKFFFSSYFHFIRVLLGILLIGNGDINWDRLRCFPDVFTDVVYFHTNRLVSNLEDQLFYTITEGQEMITLTQFTSVSAHPPQSFPRVLLSSNTNTSSAGFKKNRLVDI